VIIASSRGRPLRVGHAFRGARLSGEIPARRFCLHRKKSNSESPCGEINRQELEKFADFIDQNLAIDVTLRVDSAIEDNCGFSKFVPMLNSVSRVA
jgi:hypothetical protein